MKGGHSGWPWEVAGGGGCAAGAVPPELPRHLYAKEVGATSTRDVRPWVLVLLRKHGGAGATAFLQ